jgi:hypothetical protein
VSKFIFRGPTANLGRFGSIKNGDILDLTAAEILTVAADTRFSAVPDLATLRRKIVTGNYQALAADRIVECNHSADMTVTLPAAPAFGDLIEIFDVSDDGAVANPITIEPDAELIRGQSDAVDSVTVGNAGTGFTTKPTLAIAGDGTGATASARMKVLTATPVAAGTGYAIAEDITISGGTNTTPAVARVATAKLVSIVLNAAGTGYAPGNVITTAGGTASIPAALTVATTKVVSATVAAGGTGDLGNGAGVIVEGTTGTGTKFRASVTIAANAIASVQSISLAGAYTANPTLITAEPVTYISGGASGTTLTGAQLSVVLGVASVTISTPGSYTVLSASLTQSGATTPAGGTGATFQTASYGVLTMTIQTAGDYSVLPVNPAAQASSTGSGTGATLTLTWGVLSVTVTAVGSGYTAATCAASGGGGTGAAFTVVLTSANTVINTDGGRLGYIYDGSFWTAFP